MVTINEGSIEYIPIKIADVLGGVTDLTGTNPRYQYGLADSDTLTALASAVVDGTDKMLLQCLIDATSLEAGEFDLFVTFAIAPQYPRLKFNFTVA